MLGAFPVAGPAPAPEPPAEYRAQHDCGHGARRQTQHPGVDAAHDHITYARGRAQQDEPHGLEGERQNVSDRQDADGQRVAVSLDAQRLQLWDIAALRQQFRELGLDWRQDRSEVAQENRQKRL